MQGPVQGQGLAQTQGLELEHWTCWLFLVVDLEASSCWFAVE